MTCSSCLESATEIVRWKMAKPSAVVWTFIPFTLTLQVLMAVEMSTSRPDRSLHTTSREVE